MRSPFAASSRVLGFVLPTLIAACSGSESAGPSEDTGGSAATETTAGLDVNDVSILFPPPETEAARDSMLSFMSGKDRKEGPLLSTALFDGILEKAREEADIVFNPFDPESKSNGDHAAWRVVGIRFDPCSDNPKKLDLTTQEAFERARCRPELRLVTQPFNGLTANDQAIHLVFSLAGPNGYSLVREVARELAEIKKASADSGHPTAYVPLGAHPGLNAKAATPTSARIQKLVLDHAKPVNLSQIACMFTASVGGGGAVNWSFFSLFIDSSSSSGPKIASVRELGNVDGRTVKVDTFGSGHRADQSLMHPTRNVKVFEEAANKIFFAGNMATVNEAFSSIKPADVQALNELLDPTKTSIVEPNSNPPKLFTNCVSCHRTTANLNDYGHWTVALAKSGGNIDKFRKADDDAGFLKADGSELDIDRSTGFRAPPGLTWFARQDTLSTVGWDIRNFGFAPRPANAKASRVALSRFTINESVLVAAALNKIVGSANPSPLKPGCDVAGLERCIFKGGGSGCYTKLACR